MELADVYDSLGLAEEAVQEYERGGQEMPPRLPYMRRSCGL